MRIMKDSGISWVGKVPTGWDVNRGKYVFEYVQKPIREDDGVVTCFRDGEVTLRSNRREEGFTMSDKEIGYQGIDVGDLIVHGMDGFSGAIGISDSRGKASPVLNVLDTNQNKKYYMYYLRSAAWSGLFISLATGIRVRTCDTNWGKLREISYLLPPLKEQVRIADFLDSKCAEIDALSADIQSEIDTLETYKRSVITEAVTKGLDKKVPMKDSGIEWIGEIPQSADLIRLSYISSLRNGYVGPTKDIFVDDGVRYIQSLHIKSGRIKYDNNYYVNELWGQNHPKIHTGNLLFTQTGDIGQVALVEDDFDGCNCHALIICDVKQDKCNSKYLLYYFLGNAGLEELLRYETGTTLKHLNSTKIKNSLVVLHSMTEQMRIVAYLDNKCAEIEAIISRKQKQMDILADYKKSVIYEYVTGKKEVPVT